MEQPSPAKDPCFQTASETGPRRRDSADQRRIELSKSGEPPKRTEVGVAEPMDGRPLGIVGKRRLVMQMPKDVALFQEPRVPVEEWNVVLEVGPTSERRCRFVVVRYVIPPGLRTRKISDRLITGDSTCSNTLSKNTRSCDSLGTGIDSAAPCTTTFGSPRYSPAAWTNIGTGSTPVTV